ncbi:dephospho-CoA kinase [Pinisolibacter sp.]|uniref:dephospho-CoA kinase n=1 Tax=Pinisolibacter sp. TaxID=2172024 RepID=UPI002FDE74A6
MIRLGLTGSIGMGKSTTAAFFRGFGVPVHDADATVHALYRGAAVAPIEAAFPGTTRDGVVDRPMLAARVLGDDAAVKRLEAIVHPLVRDAEIAFLGKARAEGRRIVVLDIPLLFETGGDTRVDAVVTVTAPAEVQRARVLARPGMTAEKFEQILARQVSDAEKRCRSHFLVDTAGGLEPARRQVGAVLAALAAMNR